MVTRARALASRVFHGWWIVSGGMAIQALISALFLQSYGVYAAFWMEEFGWSRTTISLAYSLHRTESGLLGPIQGWLLQRTNPRNLILAGIAALGFGFMALAVIQNFSQFVAVFMLMAVGASLAGILSLMTVIVNWFERRRATALALLSTGVSAGGLAVPLVAAAMVELGWRPVAVASGILILLVGVPAAWLMRRDPESLGLQPDGEARAQAEGDPGSARPLIRRRQGVSAGSAMRTGTFWLLSLGHTAAIAVVSAFLVHFVIFSSESVGLKVTTGAALLMLCTAMAMLGQLAGGVIGDRTDRRLLAGAGMLGHGAGMALLAWAPSVAVVAGAVVLHGLAWGLRGPLMGALRADYFGRESFAMVMGISSAIVTLGSVGGPLLVGLMADATGNYQAAFATLAGIAFTGAVGFFALRPAGSLHHEQG